ncbi:helix-turn-helix domain-containing protein [Gandjariella thermophila]|uniref:AraC family transcriptional regulator n=1 Tax=Gandjariella thermophila TaxID=1931992 RepID=A0A4D4J6X6_9PSEU|nr:helix-turn-helix domain-containing protein [Gandjariella thermophila]GDY30289.1 AraC family transcriptional regulator [Gandjariella thermophila]
MLRDVAAVLGDEVQVFELAVLCEIFGIDRSGDGLPRFDFAICAADPRPRPAVGGMSVQPGHGLERALTADLVAVPGWPVDGPPPSREVVDVLRAAVDRGATVLSVCSGVFVLAAAGLLDGRRATCHWYHADRLRARYTAVAVQPDRLYVADGPVVTSAGTAAGIDACLYLVRRELGAQVANGIARRMVVPPHRDGGQAQYVETPVPRRRGGDDLGPLLEWLQAHLDEPHSVATLAARVHMSPRTFARRFAASTGTTPHGWITRQRVLLAQRLLEESDLDVETIARRCGFGNGEALRHHFARSLGTTPTAYRNTFGHHLTPAGTPSPLAAAR